MGFRAYTLKPCGSIARKFARSALHLVPGSQREWVGGGGGEFLAGCTPPIDPDRDYRVDGLEPESGLWNDGVWEKLYERVEEFGDVKVKVRRDRGGERDDGLIMGGCCSWRTGNITHNLRGGPTTAVNSRALIPHPFRDCASLAVSLIPLPVAE